MTKNYPKSELPVHLELEASEYSRIKTVVPPKIGNVGEPVAEYTRFGWTIISPGTELDLSNLYITQSTVKDYDRLCSLDVLGIEDSPSSRPNAVYEDFKQQLVRSSEDWYETGLVVWKTGHPPLPTSKKVSLARWCTLLRKLRRNPALYQDYDAVIKEYLEQGIVEKVPNDVGPTEKVFLHST